MTEQNNTNLLEFFASIGLDLPSPERLCAHSGEMEIEVAPLATSCPASDFISDRSISPLDQWVMVA